MLKILRNRSAVVLMLCALVLVAIGVAAFIEQGSRDNTQQTPSIKNINALQKALIEKNATVCDEIKGETRRDEIDYTETEATFDKDTKAVPEAEARKRCHEAVAEAIEADRQRQQSQNSLR